MVFRTYTLPVLVEPARAGADITAYVCEEDVLQGQLVKPGGTNSDEVEPSDTDGEQVVGVALYDASAGDTVDVAQRANKVRLTSGSGTISAGDAVASHGGTGEEGEVDTAAAGDFVIGEARFDDSGDGGDVIVTLDLQYGSDL